MVPYILHVSVLLATFFIFYKVFLEKETFYILNRFFLVSSLIFSLTLPFISVPETLSFHRNSQAHLVKTTEAFSPIAKDGLKEFKTESKNTSNKSKADPSSLSNSGIITKVTSINWPLLLWRAYLVGSGIFLLNFLIQFGIIFIKRIRLESFRDGIFRIVELKDNTAPFSFLNWIFINPSAYDPETFDQILDHEKIHVEQAHFADKLMAEFMVIIFWFNPFSWLYRKSISNNLEYITDNSMLNLGTEKQQYQMNLLKISVPQHALDLTTNYNESFLTKRIKMMNSRKSSAKSSWKYLLVFPIMALSIASMNKLQAESNDALSSNNTPQSKQINLDNLDPQEENKIKSKNKKSKTKTKSKELKKSEKANIKKASKEDKKKNKIKWDYDRITPGHWQGKIRSNDICFYLNNSKGVNKNWTIHECFPKSNFQDIQNGQLNDYIVKREAGILTLTGTFEGDNGEGVFNFEANTKFVKALSNYGINNVQEDDLFQIFLNNTDLSYIKKLTDDGYQPDIKDIVNSGIHGVDDKYDDFKRIFELTQESGDIQRMTEMSIHGVELERVEAMSKLNTSDLSTRKMVDAHIHGVSNTLIDAVKRYNFQDLMIKDLIDMSIHGVSGNYIDKMSKLGYKTMSTKNFIDFAIHGVQIDFIQTALEKNMKFAPQDFINMSIHGANASYLNGLDRAGFNNLSGKEIEAAKIHGVSTQFARQVKDAGYSNIGMDRLIEFRIHGVDINLIQGMNNLGLNYKEADLVEAAIHGVSVNYVKDLQKFGLSGLTPKGLVEAKIHGVSTSFINKAKGKGHNLKSLKEYVKLKISGI